MKYQYKYCSNCGELFDKKSETLYVCPKCDFRIFVSPKPAAGALIFNSLGQLLMTKRAQDPKKNMWGVIGGFIDPNESHVDTLKREIKEEINANADNFNFFGSYAGKYDYKHIMYNVISSYYICDELDIDNIKLSDESLEYKFFDLDKIRIEDVGLIDDKKAITELIRSKLH